MKEMKEKKFKLKKNMPVKYEINRTGNNKNKQSNKNLISKNCGKGPNLKKKAIIKEDGRYLIYYDF